MRGWECRGFAEREPSVCQRTLPPERSRFPFLLLHFGGIVESRAVRESLKSKGLGTTERPRGPGRGRTSPFGPAAWRQALPRGLSARTPDLASREPTCTQPAAPAPLAASPRHRAAPRTARPQPAGADADERKSAPRRLRPIGCFILGEKPRLFGGGIT